MFDNKGNAYHRKKDDVAGDYINNLTLNYTIKPKEIGLVYGRIFVKTNDQDEKNHILNRITLIIMLVLSQI